jgi:hypothetical protein
MQQVGHQPCIHYQQKKMQGFGVKENKKRKIEETQHPTVIDLPTEFFCTVKQDNHACHYKVKFIDGIRQHA